MKKCLIVIMLVGIVVSAFAEQCKAITRKGTRCKRAASQESEFCWQHGGATKAERKTEAVSASYKACREKYKVRRSASGNSTMRFAYDSSTVKGRWDNLQLGTPGQCDQVIDREGFAIGYNEKWEQPSWVTYRLTKSEVMNRKSSRLDDFRSDPVVKSGSAELDDYRGSGYDRGHLAPAGDMHWSDRAMHESFFMSNMSPQNPLFNRGIWARLERAVRRFAYSEGSVFVVTGPIVKSGAAKKIGPNNVCVPDMYYKVIYDETPPQKMIAFILPNEGVNNPLDSYVVSVDEVESLTGLDFFSALPEETQNRLEAKSCADDWSWRDSRRGGR